MRRAGEMARWPQAARGAAWLSALFLAAGAAGISAQTAGPWSLAKVAQGDFATVEPGGERAAILRAKKVVGYPLWTLTMVDLHTRKDVKVVVTEQLSRAHLTGPSAVVFAPDGRTIAIVDSISHRIKVVNVANFDAVTVRTLADGIEDGEATTAKFSFPQDPSFGRDASFGPLSDFLIVSDTGNHRIRKVTFPGGDVATVAGSVSGLKRRDFSNADMKRRGFPDIDGDVTTVAGSVPGFANGLGTEARVSNPAGGDVTTVAGGVSGFANGIGTVARFQNPAGVAVSPGGLTVVVADEFNHRIRLVDLRDQRVTTLAGSSQAGTFGQVSTLAGSVQGFRNGLGATVKFNNPVAVAYFSGGAILVGDKGNSLLRYIDAATNEGDRLLRYIHAATNEVMRISSSARALFDP
ncbi:hypothetical protein T484DRAFT_1898820 [Baffinella frigidus]|nr:hypothetical protein T484DRAFT_1898820 [Cryptophyta sp. CCMP2293]